MAISSRGRAYIELSINSPVCSITLACCRSSTCFLHPCFDRPEALPRRLRHTPGFQPGLFFLAAQFVTALPAGSDLPFKAFPVLAASDPTGQGYWPGGSVVFKGAQKNAVDAGKSGSPLYAVFYSALQTYYVPASVAGDPSRVSPQYPPILTLIWLTAIIPGANFATEGQAAPAGKVYVVLSTANGKDTTASDESIVAGVGIIEVLCY